MSALSSSGPRGCEIGGGSGRGLSPTGLCDGSHPIGRWVNNASYHAWVPILASRLLPVGVVCLLTYYLRNERSEHGRKSHQAFASGLRAMIVRLIRDESATFGT